MWRAMLHVSTEHTSPSFFLQFFKGFMFGSFSSLIHSLKKKSL